MSRTDVPVSFARSLSNASTWAWTKKQEADRYEVDAELGRIISQADVTKCGERLCANLETMGKRYGDNNQYRPVKKRP